MGWKSPVGVPTCMCKDNHEPKARASSERPRPEEAGGQEVRGDGQKPHSQGRGWRGELAHGSKAHRYAAYGKCGACAPTVRVLTWGDLRGKRDVLLVQGPDWSSRVIKDRAPRRAARRVSKKLAATTSAHSARLAVTPGVTAQKSAEVILGPPGPKERTSRPHGGAEQTSACR